MLGSLLILVIAIWAVYSLIMAFANQNEEPAAGALPRFLERFAVDSYRVRIIRSLKKNPEVVVCASWIEIQERSNYRRQYQGASHHSESWFWSYRKYWGPNYRGRTPCRLRRPNQKQGYFGILRLIRKSTPLTAERRTANRRETCRHFESVAQFKRRFIQWRCHKGHFPRPTITSGQSSHCDVKR